MTKESENTGAAQAKGNPPVIDCEKMNCREINLEGTLYKTHFSRKYENKKPWKKPDPGKVVSFIPGTILRVMVQPGDEVQAGDDVLILEAMKMQNRVKAGKSAKVRKVHVKEGDRVPKGFVMVEIK
jgi:biotin carboxyl carrier protein